MSYIFVRLCSKKIDIDDSFVYDMQHSIYSLVKQTITRSLTENRSLKVF